MDQLENVESFKLLVQRQSLRPRPIDKKKANMNRNDETIIAARIRPLLQEEIDSNQVEGTIARSPTMVDVHSMTLGLPSGPKLNVSTHSLPSLLWW
jgi:hypothetical protein